MRTNSYRPLSGAGQTILQTDKHAGSKTYNLAVVILRHDAGAPPSRTVGSAGTRGREPQAIGITRALAGGPGVVPVAAVDADVLQLVHQVHGHDVTDAQVEATRDAHHLRMQTKSQESQGENLKANSGTTLRGNALGDRSYSMGCVPLEYMGGHLGCKRKQGIRAAH